MGIQINGNNDIISALDGSWTAEGASINTSGILTATTFKGNIVGTAATFTGPVTIGGTLTYEDVTNIDSVGILTARAGIHIDDSITHIGDTNTKIRFPAADQIQLETGGSSRVNLTDDRFQILNRLLTSGDYNYLSGTSSSNATLTLKKSASGADSIDYLQLRDNSNALKLKIGGDGIIYTSDVLASHEGDTNTKIRFPAADTITVETGGTERLRIAANGRVGILTVTPEARLDVYDTSGLGIISRSASTQATDSNKALKVRNNSTTDTFNVSYKGQGYFAGKVGMGTENPGHILDLYNSVGTDCLRLNVSTAAGGSNKQNAIRYSVDGTVKAHVGVAVDAGKLISTSGANDFCVKTNSANNIIFATDSSEAFRISSAGRVGINETSPDSLLHVRNDNSYAAKFGGQGGGSDYYIEIGQLATNGSPGFNATGTSTSMLFQVGGSEKLRIKSNGSVGINTTLTQSGGGNIMVNIAASSQAFSGSTNLADGGGLMFQPTDTLPSTGRSYPGIFWSGNTASLDRMRAGIIGVTASNHDATHIAFLTRYAADGTGLTPADERMRIDSSGRLRVASTTESADSAFDDLIVGNHSGNRGISILSTNGQQGALGFAKSGTLADGYVAYVHNSTATSSVMTIKSSGLIKFSAGGQERLRMTGNELRFIGGDQNSNEGSKTTKIVYRSLTATVWNTVEIGNITGSNGTTSFRMTVNCPNSGWSITKIYDITAAFNFTTGNWRIVKPISSTYQYDGDDFEVNIKTSNAVTYLRLRKNRSSSSRSGTLQVIMEIYGKGEVFSGTSSTGSDSGSLFHYEGTPIGAYSDTSANVGGQMDYNGGQRVQAVNYGALISDDNGSIIPNEFPANHRQLMVYTSTNGQPIGNQDCARVLIATDAKQTGAQGYHGSLDFGSSDCSASGGATEFQWRTAAIMCRGDGDTSPAIGDGDLQFWTKQASGSLTHRFDIAPNGDLTGTDTSIGNLSDQRLKKNIQDYTYDLNKFKQLKTRTFDWINPEFHREGNQRGFIAQEVETVDNYWNYQFEVAKESAEKDYDLLTDGGEDYTIRDHRPGKASKLNGKDAMYVSVIQQLMSKIETLEAKVTALEGS